jgi:DNA polymerase (family 10)
MARAALELGREYIAITDHTRDLAMTGGLDEEGLRAQVKEIRKVDRRLDGIRVLTGAEVNVRPDGTLDVDDRALSQLDVVGAAIHSHFDQPRTEMTKRILRAVENPHVDILFHPTARALGRRPPVAVDFDAVIEACLRTGTVLEIDAQPERLDLSDALARRAVEAGVRIAVDSDAHTTDELRYIETYGVGVARRGWVPAERVINTLPVRDMLGALKG